MTFIKNHNGSATLLTMFMAAVIITVGIAFNWLVKEHMKASEAIRVKAEAVLKARSAYDTLVYLILNNRVSQREMILASNSEISELNRIPLDGQKVSLFQDVYVQVQDSNGKLSLATMNRPVMERLIQRVGGIADPSEIINSYLDWIDGDNLTRINGAEEFYYRSQGLPYTPRNCAIQFKEEFQYVRGMNKELYAKLEPYLTILPSTGFNPNTSSDAVLMAYLDLNEDTLKPLKEFLSGANVRRDMEMFALTGRKIVTEVGGTYFFPSYFFELTVSVGSPRSIYTIKAGLHVIQNHIYPVGVLYWMEE